MREYNFRAWLKKERQMDFVSEMDFACKYLKTVNCVKELRFNFEAGYLNDIFLMQYAGSKDKTGQDIYDGDIVLIECLSGKFSEYYVVNYNENFCCFSLTSNKNINNNKCFKLIKNNVSDKHGFVYNSFVKGNIYENPELLEDK